MNPRRPSPATNLLAVVAGVSFALLVAIGMMWLARRDDTSADRTTVPATTVPTTPSTTAPTTTTTTTSTTTTSTTTTTTLPFAADTSTKSNGLIEGSPGPSLTAVRVGDHPESNSVRVVFDLTGEGQPWYVVGYEAGPFTTVGEETVEVGGSAFIAVSMSPARVQEPTFDGSRRFAPGYDPIVEIAFVDDFEGTATWVIGLTGEQPFRVRVFQDPLRLAIDILR